jgi:hypothetical protein
MSSYLRDALQEGGGDAVACLPVPRFFSLFILFAWWLPLLFLVRILWPSVALRTTCVVQTISREFMGLIRQAPLITPA